MEPAPSQKGGGSGAEGQSERAQPKGRSQGKGRSKGRCRVDGCTASVAQLKPFYQRQHICEKHFKALSITDATGRRQRFCQQCTKLHPITGFDGARRSCRDSLAKRQERRAAKAVDQEWEKVEGDQAAHSGSNSATVPGRSSGTSDGSLPMVARQQARAAAAAAAAASGSMDGGSSAADSSFATVAHLPPWFAGPLQQSSDPAITAYWVHSGAQPQPPQLLQPYVPAPSFCTNGTASGAAAAAAAAQPTSFLAAPAQPASPGAAGCYWPPAAAAAAAPDVRIASDSQQQQQVHLEWIGDLHLPGGSQVAMDDVADLLIVDSDSLIDALLNGSVPAALMLPSETDSGMLGHVPSFGPASQQTADAAVAAAAPQASVFVDQNHQQPVQQQQHPQQQQQQQQQQQYEKPLSRQPHALQAAAHTRARLPPNGVCFAAGPAAGPAPSNGTAQLVPSSLELAYAEMRTSIKLHGTTPDQLPPELRGSLLHSLGIMPGTFAQAATRHGCVHITLSALASKQERGRLVAPGAAGQALAALLPQLPAAAPRVLLQVGTSSAAMLVRGSGGQPPLLINLPLQRAIGAQQLLPAVTLCSARATTVSAAQGCFRLRCSPELLIHSSGGSSSGREEPSVLHARCRGRHVAVSLGLPGASPGDSSTDGASSSDEDGAAEAALLACSEVEVEVWVPVAELQRQEDEEERACCGAWQQGWGLYEFEVSTKGALLVPAVPVLVLPDGQEAAAAELARLPCCNDTTAVLHLAGMVLQYFEDLQQYQEVQRGQQEGEPGTAGGAAVAAAGAAFQAQYPPTALARLESVAQQLRALSRRFQWAAVEELLAAAAAGLAAGSTSAGAARQQQVPAGQADQPPDSKSAERHAEPLQVSPRKSAGKEQTGSSADGAPGGSEEKQPDGATAGGSVADLACASGDGASSAKEVPGPPLPRVAAEDKQRRPLSATLLGAFSLALVASMLGMGAALLGGAFS